MDSLKLLIYFPSSLPRRPLCSSTSKILIKRSSQLHVHCIWSPIFGSPFLLALSQSHIIWVSLALTFYLVDSRARIRHFTVSPLVPSRAYISFGL